MKLPCTLALDPDLRDQIDAVAMREERSRSAVAARAIRAGLAAASAPTDHAPGGQPGTPQPRNEAP